MPISNEAPRGCCYECTMCGRGTWLEFSALPPPLTESKPNALPFFFSVPNQSCLILTHLSWKAKSAQTLIQKKPFACNFHIQSEGIEGLIPFAGKMSGNGLNVAYNEIMTWVKIVIIFLSNALDTGLHTHTHVHVVITLNIQQHFSPPGN